MSPRDLATLVLLSALWGGSFLFIRIGAPVLGPVVLIELRVLLAGLALLGYALVTRTLPPLRALWRHYLVIGSINSALPFVLISAAELHLPASAAATFNATTPMFGAVVAALWLKEAMTPRKLAGLLAGFAGVAVLVGLGPVPMSSRTLLSAGGCLAAAAAYSAGAVYTRLTVRDGQPLALAMYSQFSAALVLLPLVPYNLPDRLPDLPVVASLLALALASTALAYLLYFRLILKAGPLKAMMVTYLAPAFGMLWGFLFLREPLGVGSGIGFGLILASVALVSGRSATAAAPASRPAAQRS